MRTYHTILIDPSLGEVAEEIALAARAANRGCRTRLLPDDPAKARKIARQTAATAGDITQLRGGRGGIPASQVLVSWWSDHIGRKHVVVRGRCVDTYDTRDLLRPDVLAQNPPLWHCYPERLYRRQASGSAQWVAVCGCGAMGTPEALAWMGDVCGPCHDQRLEFGPTALVHHRPGFLPGDRQPMLALAFREDGQELVGVDGNGNSNGMVHVWSLADGSVRHRLKSPDWMPPHSVCVTADGRFIVTSGSPMNVAGGVAHRDAVAYGLSVDPPVQTVLTVGDTFGVVAGPGPGEVTIATDRGFAVLNPVTQGMVRDIAFANTWGSFPFLSVGGSHLVAIRPGSFTVSDRRDGRHIVTVPFTRELDEARAMIADLKAAFLPDGNWLYVAAGILLQAFDAAAGRVRATTRLPQTVRHLALDPDGRYLLCGLADGTIVVLALNLTPRLTLNWHLLPLRALALSADGEVLVTGSLDGGVKLWPIRQLVGDG